MGSTALTCNRCGHVWQTKARYPNSVACPNCKHYKRVPKLRATVNGQANVNAWAETETEPNREKTEHDCPECGEPLYWAQNRTSQYCDGGHWYLPPDTADRSAKLIRIRASVAEREPEPTVTDKARLDMARDAVVNQCNAGITEYDTSYLCDTGMPDSWQESICAGYRSLFASLARQATSASFDELNEIKAVYVKAYNDTEAQQTRMRIRQALSEWAARLAYRSNGRHVYKVAREANRIYRQPDNENDDLSRPEPTLPVRQYSVRPAPIRLAIERPARYEPEPEAEESEPEPEDYHEPRNAFGSEYDDESGEDDYSDLYNSPRDKRGLPVNLIVTGIVIAGIVYVIVKTSNAIKTHGLETCVYAPDYHKFRKPLATLGWQAQAESDNPQFNGPAYTCSAKRCYERASREYATLEYGQSKSPLMWELPIEGLAK